jgi:sugar phosphate isomerase/epimerase
MYKTLSPGAVGVKFNDLPSALAGAKKHGFGGLEVGASQIADLVDQHGADGAKRLFADAGVRPAAMGLPVDWRGAEDTWRADLEKLPRQAKAAQALGVTRTATWVLPGSNDRGWDAHWDFMTERFRPIAKILADHGISIGLEFIGPKTLRDTFKYPFVHSMLAMVSLGRDIGPNVGLLLDCWHWYTAHNTVADLKRLKAREVVYVHVNDAPAGIETDKQVDNTRALPDETGVIDIAGFLGALKAIGYDGPVTPEPFKKELKELPSDDERLKVVGQSMDTIFKKAGLPTGR